MAWWASWVFKTESIQAATELGAKAAMPIHWGAFTLEEHPWDDPAERFVKAGEERGLPVVTPMIGEGYPEREPGINCIANQERSKQ
ncbi:hypothetical protein HJV72_17930 [Extibacter sp. GGCC_0201]|nr:hypothetical protein [Extibacter sp. GGCC_0201]